MYKQHRIITKITSFFKSLIGILSAKEKSIVGVLAIVAIISGTFLIWQNYFANTHFVADFGGTYREGIVSQKSSDLRDTINRLTKIGLTKFDNDGNIMPEVAQSWEISEDVKEYVFTIDKKFSRDEVLAQLQKQKDKFVGIDISAHDEQKIKFSFPQSYSPFLAESTEPILEYGPYKLVRETSSELEFSANSDFYLERPYIAKIVLKIYPDKNNLQKAFSAGEIDGVFDTYDETWSKTNSYQFMLPRYNLAFFNISREVLTNQETRKKIANGEKFDAGLKLTMVSMDTPEYRKIMENLLAKWHEQNIEVDLYFKPAQDLTNNIIPKRDYDVLVYGFDYGRDPDPYPFWHSTQSGENGFNLSNFSHIDSDKALEAARKTKDLEARKKYLEEFQKYFNEEVPAIIISQDQWQFAVSEKVKGVETGYSINLADRYQYIYKWYLKEKRVKIN